jgi:hypothetical protein
MFGIQAAAIVVLIEPPQAAMLERQNHALM